MPQPPLTDREKKVYDLLGKTPVSARDLRNKLDLDVANIRNKLDLDVANIRAQLRSLGQKGYAKRSTVQRRVKVFGTIERSQPTVVWTKI